MSIKQKLISVYVIAESMAIEPLEPKQTHYRSSPLRNESCFYT